jgi:hypothetical protein
MATYRVKPGFEHGAMGQHKAGFLVEYTEQEAAGFLDKLELVASDGVLSMPVDPLPVHHISQLTIDRVMELVISVLSAADALELERAGKNRVTLIETLKGLIDGADNHAG